MGQIKIYQQGRLADIAVGTPGVDQSGGMVANAALQANETQLQNQQVLNNASMQSANSMRGSALDTNNTINRALIENRQNAINNQQALTESQVEFGNRAQTLQGERMAQTLGILGQNAGYDYQVAMHNRRQAEERVRASSLALERAQDILNVKAFLPQMAVKMKQYAAQLNQGVVNGSLDGNTVGDTYNEGIESIKQNVMDSIPSRYSSYAKEQILEHMLGFQATSAGELAEFGRQQATTNAKNNAVQQMSNKAGRIGIDPWQDAAGNTYPATSQQALTAGLANINSQVPGLELAVGKTAANEIVQDTKRAGFINWAEQNIAHGNTEIIKKYIEPNKESGKMPADAFVELDHKTVEKLQEGIIAEDSAKYTAQERHDKYIDDATKGRLLSVTAKAETSPKDIFKSRLRKFYKAIWQSYMNNLNREIEILLLKPP